jgi:hypothetical protein
MHRLHKYFFRALGCCPRESLSCKLFRWDIEVQTFQHITTHQSHGLYRWIMLLLEITTVKKRCGSLLRVFSGDICLHL